MIRKKSGNDIEPEMILFEQMNHNFILILTFLSNGSREKR